MTPDELTPGATYHIGSGCGVPYEWAPLILRVIKVDDAPAGRNIAWLTGYQLNDAGTATEHRTVYVGQVSGIRRLDTPATTTADLPRRRPTNAGPARIPRPRTSPEPITRRTR